MAVLTLAGRNHVHTSHGLNTTQQLRFPAQHIRGNAALGRYVSPGALPPAAASSAPTHAAGDRDNAAAEGPAPPPLGLRRRNLQRRSGPQAATEAVPAPRAEIAAARAALPQQPDEELEGPREDEVVAADSPAPAEHHQPRHPANASGAPEHLHRPSRRPHRPLGASATSRVTS